MMVSKKLNTILEIDRPLTKNKISEDSVEMFLNPERKTERQPTVDDVGRRPPEDLVQQASPLQSAPRYSTVATNTTHSTPQNRYHPYQPRSIGRRYVVQNTAERSNPRKHDPCCIFECFIALLTVILIMFMMMAYSTITKEHYPIDYIFNVTNVTLSPV